MASVMVLVVVSLVQVFLVEKSLLVAALVLVVGQRHRCTNLLFRFYRPRAKPVVLYWPVFVNYNNINWCSYWMENMMWWQLTLTGWAFVITEPGTRLWFNPIVWPISWRIVWSRQKLSNKHFWRDNSREKLSSCDFFILMTAISNWQIHSLDALLLHLIFDLLTVLNKNSHKTDLHPLLGSYPILCSCSNTIWLPVKIQFHNYDILSYSDNSGKLVLSQTWDGKSASP